MNSVSSAVQSSSLTEKIVLLALADATVSGETPVASVDIRPHCQSLLDDVDAAVVSLPKESDIMRALSTLGTEPYVTEMSSSTSPTGKGRPRYELDTDVSSILDALKSDGQLSASVEYVRPE